MATITDKLLLGPSELSVLTEHYPECEVVRLTESEGSIQQYRLRIENEEEESYYNFLLDNVIAMSSTNFYEKVKNDKSFSDRMKARIEGEKPS